MKLPLFRSRRCALCPQSFTPIRQNQLYCSEPCRHSSQKASKRRWWNIVRKAKSGSVEFRVRLTPAQNKKLLLLAAQEEKITGCSMSALALATRTITAFIEENT